MTWDAVTLKSFEAEWREALSGSSTTRAREGGGAAALAGSGLTSPVLPDGRIPTDDHHVDDPEARDEDPFDCSSVEIPCLHELVEESAMKFVREWKALDGRKINVAPPATAAPTSKAGDGPGGSPPPRKKKKKKVPMRQDTGMPLWYDHPNRVRLPLHFDYLCRHPTADAEAAAGAAAAHTANPDPASSLSTTPGDPRVQSLVDPTLTTSYRAELWNLFARIPSAERLRRDLLGDQDDDDTHDDDDDGSDRAAASNRPVFLSRTRKLAAGYSTSPHFPSQQHQQTRQKRNRKAKPATTHDNLCLWTRLRLSDRHEPPPPWVFSSFDARDPQGSMELVATIRFECWRGRHVTPTRSVLPDSNRMSVEFLKSHTLLDFHRVLVEQARDDLWTKSRHVADAGADPAARDENEATRDGDDGSASPDDVVDDETGFFFMEDTFYVAGAAKAAEAHVAPIKAWLGDEDPTESRLARLGVRVASSHDLKIAQMSETRLEDVPLRLGIRYVHVHHGNVECSVYCVDRRVHAVPASESEAESAWSRMHPILHDVWTNPYATPACEACQHRTAALVTSPTCEVTDGGPRALCGPCARQLQVPESELELYTVYRGG